jgi:hypothetical protein
MMMNPKILSFLPVLADCLSEVLEKCRIVWHHFLGCIDVKDF